MNHTVTHAFFPKSARVYEMNAGLTLQKLESKLIIKLNIKI
ncbi:hypothetical protein J500_0923 [Acinetobacter sp. 479375]|nr:hypothetical protein J500_0923 [Acinetobacter sp. 479375]